MGHNILEHDLRYLRDAAPAAPWLALPVIDTLRLSPLTFPQNPYHRLIKNHKIISSAKNSPEADCRACWQLFQDMYTTPIIPPVPKALILEELNELREAGEI